MAQVINDSTVGGRLGSSFGTGLQQLAQNKLAHVMSQHDLLQQQQFKRENEQHERSRYAQSLAPILGPTASNFLSNLGPKEREHALQNPNLLQGLRELDQGNNQAPINGMAALTSDNNQPQSIPNQPQSQPSSISPKDKSKTIANLFTSPHERREEEKLGIKKQEFERQSSKDVREYLAPYAERATKNKANLRDYKELKELAEKGDIRAGNVHQLLTKLGLQDFGRNATTEIAGKLIARLAQNVSGVFGQNSRITNFLEQTFQRSIPDLKNTPEGIIAISILNSAVDEGELVIYEARKQIIKENNGKIPGDIDDQVEKRTDDVIKRLDEKAFLESQQITEPLLNKKSKQSNKQSSSKVLPQFGSLPSAKEYMGKRFRDTDTGKIFESNGIEFLPVG